MHSRVGHLSAYISTKCVIVPVVVEEEWVVGEGRHGDTNLAQIVEILQHRDLQQKTKIVI